tara:strand:+ start:278 stop:1021 length:744 start_codon:yes stop_codon:yes gene_type:complete
MFKKLNSKKQLKKPNAVLLDTDNTLYEYEPAHKRAINETSKKLNNLLCISKKEFFEFYKLARKQIKKELGNVASSHSRLLYFQRLLELCGLKAELLTALDLEQTYWRTFLANAPLFKGVELFLESLKIKKIPIAIVTDLTAHIQLRKLTYFNLENTFDAVVTSEEAGADKPDLRNFDLVLKKLHIKNSNNIWMIGDNPETDIRGGKLINALTFQKIHTNVKIGENKDMPDFVFDSFEELNQILNKFE